MPWCPAAALVVVQPDLAFGLLKGFLDCPSGAGSFDQGAQWDRCRCPAAVEGQFPARLRRISRLWQPGAGSWMVTQAQS